MFIALVESYGISFHEKTLGQLFCDGSSQQIIDLLTAELRKAGGVIWLELRDRRQSKRPTAAFQ